MCDTELSGRRTSWCSDECSDAYYRITSSAFLRAETFERDKGVCGYCGIDTYAIERRVKALDYLARKAAWKVLNENGFNSYQSMWQADHVIPMAEGGSSEPSNIVTSCTPCHKAKTAEQAARTAMQRKLIGQKWIDTARNQRMLPFP